MAVKSVVVRPQVYTWTRWEGNNQEELETHYGVEFTVDNEGNLERPNSHFGDTSPVPQGYWFSNQAMGYTSDTDFNNQYQEVSDSLLSYNITEG